MQYINFAFLSMKKNAAAFILIILELAALFLTVNFSVSTVNDRQMLNATFKTILDDDTVYVDDFEFFNRRIEYGVDRSGSRQMLLDEISGGYEVYDVITCTTSKYRIISVSDEIYSHLKMPLINGSYKKAVATFGTSLGEHSIELESGTLTLNVSGTLTGSTYLPIMDDFNTADFTTRDIFQSSIDEPNVIITNRTAIGNFKAEFTPSLGFFVKLNGDYEANEARLREVAAIMPSADIIKNSKKALREDIAGFAPILLCVLFIVIIGTVSISAILDRQNEYRNGVLWISGYSKKQILLSYSITILIILILSICVSAAVVGILKLLENELAMTMKMSVANVLTSVLVCVFLLFVSLIIPIIKSAKKSPVEYLGRAK